ncbi:YdcF family protein [Neisseria sp.]|uniref:YdcF family protein n=1 Tax=Neisseria sp. TaxID=192066 RepID=UPI00359FE496
MKPALIILFLLAAVSAPLFYLHYRASQAAVRPSEIGNADVAVVLGNAVNRNGVPNPCLRSRVAAGVALYRAGKVPLLVMSGGTDDDGSNEAETMAAMAAEMGVPSENILLENRSTSTFENLAFSTPLVADKPRTVIVSSAFHLARARWLAEKQWPDKTLSVFAGDPCDIGTPRYIRTLLRESLSWVKALVLEALK